MKYFNKQIALEIDLDSFLLGSLITTYGMCQFLSLSQLATFMLGLVLGIGGCYYAFHWTLSRKDITPPVELMEPTAIQPITTAPETPVEEEPTIRPREEPIADDEETLEPAKYPEVRRYAEFAKIFEKNGDSLSNIKIQEIFIDQDRLTKTTLRHIIKQMLNYIKSHEHTIDFRHRAWHTILPGRSSLKTAKYIDELDMCIRNNEPAHKYIIDLFYLAIDSKIPLRFRITYTDINNELADFIV